MKNLDFRDKQLSNDFYKKLGSLKKYCTQTYKYLIFKLKRENAFQNLEDGVHYIILPTSEDFAFVYGQIKLKLRVINGNLIYEDIEPSEFFIDGYKTELKTYKSIYYRNERDKFKIDLMLRMKKHA